LSLQGKGGRNLRHGWSLGPDCQKRQMSFGKRDAWGGSPVVRLRGGGLGSKVDDKDPMLESDANEAVANDTDEVQVLYKHPRDTDAVDTAESDPKVCSFISLANARMLKISHPGDHTTAVLECGTDESGTDEILRVIHSNGLCDP